MSQQDNSEAGSPSDDTSDNHITNAMMPVTVVYMPFKKKPAVKRRRRDHNRKYNPNWEELYFFTYYDNKCICLICNFNIATLKKNNLERHFKSVHRNYETDFPENSALRSYRLKELKSVFYSDRAVIAHEAAKVKSYSEASFRLSFLIAKKKKPFEDGEMLKEAILEAAQALGSAFENKEDIINAFKDIPLSTQTVTRRVEEISKNVYEQLRHDLTSCEFFSLHFDVLDESTDAPRLVILIRLVFDDSISKEELLKMIPIRGKATGTDLFNLFKAFIAQIELPLYKLVSITTDGSPAMMSSEVGFVTLCMRDPLFPPFLNYHCVHQPQALPTKIVHFDHIVTVLVKAISSIRANAHTCDVTNLKPLLDEIEAIDGGSSHIDAQSIGKGKFLQAFIDSLPDVRMFLESRNEAPLELYNFLWLKDLSFFADFSAKLYKLNQELQSKGKTVAQMIGCVNAFKGKLDLWIHQLGNRNLQHFPNLKKIRLCGMEDAEFNLDLYINHLSSTKDEFTKRFKDFSLLEPVVAFMFNPFIEVDVNNISAKIASLFKMDSVELELEIVSIQSDIELKTRADHEQFWTLASKEKYPLLKEAAQRVHACFGSLHLSKAAQADLKVIKTKKRTRLTADHLEDCLRLALTKYQPNFTHLSESMQCQASHRV